MRTHIETLEFALSVRAAMIKTIDRRFRRITYTFFGLYVLILMACALLIAANDSTAGASPTDLIRFPVNKLLHFLQSLLTDHAMSGFVLPLLVGLILFLAAKLSALPLSARVAFGEDLIREHIRALREDPTSAQSACARVVTWTEANLS